MWPCDIKGKTTMWAVLKEAMHVALNACGFYYLDRK